MHLQKQTVTRKLSNHTKLWTTLTLLTVQTQQTL